MSYGNLKFWKGYHNYRAFVQLYLYKFLSKILNHSSLNSDFLYKIHWNPHENFDLTQSAVICGSFPFQNQEIWCLSTSFIHIFWTNKILLNYSKRIFGQTVSQTANCNLKRHNPLHKLHNLLKCNFILVAKDTFGSLRKKDCCWNRYMKEKRLREEIIA